MFVNPLLEQVFIVSPEVLTILTVRRFLVNPFSGPHRSDKLYYIKSFIRCQTQLILLRAVDDDK